MRTAGDAIAYPPVDLTKLLSSHGTTADGRRERTIGPSESLLRRPIHTQRLGLLQNQLRGLGLQVGRISIYLSGGAMTSTGAGARSAILEAWRVVLFDGSASRARLRLNGLAGFILGSRGRRYTVLHRRRPTLDRFVDVSL